MDPGVGLEKSPVKIYLLAPEANAQLIRRLRGFGMASGIFVDVAMQLSELPELPDQNATLIISESLVKNHLPVLQHWPRIVITSLEPYVVGSESGIFLSSETHDKFATWMQITSTTIAMQSTKHQPHSWQCVHKQWIDTLAAVTANFRKWTRKFKISSYAPIHKLLRDLDRLATEHGLMKTQLQASVDASALTLTIALSQETGMTSKKLEDLINAPLMTYTSLRQQRGEILLQMRIDLAKPSDVKMQITFPQTNDAAIDSSAQEAS